ncbi:DUF3618 domain-containing protein [Microvirga thermotolerans]|uniref:DUF3618 domain-containing protein n=1 Tax=Microvirga thermotolerans TaxID=2651334 RepID=A0A5P9JZ13_9HYPH|nr:DUF3618 domain-containing protein [Microvirga thermotolerans]QFU17391.1 DUF3618 domain-containing protein [Microvirga thermotolerans]
MTQNIEELERDIERSRAKLDLTIDQLQSKLTVSGVMDDMLGTVRNGRYGPTFDHMLATIRRNPVPVMLIAAGMGLLLYRLGRKPRVRTHVRVTADEDIPAYPEEPRLHETGASALQSPQDVLERRRGVNMRI